MPHARLISLSALLVTLVPYGTSLAAARYREQLQEVLAEDREASGVFIATAHPAKFREVVEPAIGAPVALPPALSDALARPRRSVSMAADYAELERFLRS